MENIKVSVVIPVYKVEEFLDECMESIVRQSHRNLEIILVDDGSPDRCGQMCDSWASKDGRIRVIHKENGGLSSARNAGIDIATGDYIAFVDSDDYIEDDTIEILLRAAEKYAAEMSCCGIKFIGEPEETEQSAEELYLPGREMVGLSYFSKEDLVGGWAYNKLYKRSLFLETGIRFPVGKLYEDTAVVPKLIYYAEHVVRVPDKLYCYRFRAGSIMQSNYSKRKCVDRMEAVYALIDFYHDHQERKLCTGAFGNACKEAIVDYCEVAYMQNREEIRECRAYLLDNYKKYWQEYKDYVQLSLLKRLVFSAFMVCPGTVAGMFMHGLQLRGKY